MFRRNELIDANRMLSFAIPRNSLKYYRKQILSCICNQTHEKFRCEQAKNERIQHRKNAKPNQAIEDQYAEINKY